jgi:Kdo2-lipid IVA lauroyltransferase/acyltransferase
MYYIVYGALYLFSLLPFFVIHGISNVLAFVIYHFVGYRKKIVLGNLRIAFPNKTEAQRIKIAKQFYIYFTDTLLEMLKMISMTTAQINKHVTAEYELINQLAAEGYSVNLMAGHQFNWEFANHYYVTHLKIPFVGVYMPVGKSGGIMDKIIFNMRKRSGTILVSATEFKHKAHQIFSQQFAMGLAADQNPGRTEKAFWVTYFGRPTPFIPGPEIAARRNNTAMVYIGFVRKKRGHYHFTCQLLCKDSKNTTEKELTILYKNKLEAHIKNHPANYLWSHKRFKYTWQPENGPVD